MNCPYRWFHTSNQHRQLVNVHDRTEHLDLSRMRIKGLEPSLLAKPEPKSGASTNSAISAGNVCHYNTSIEQSKISEIASTDRQTCLH